MLEYLEMFFGKSYTGKTARMLHEIRTQPRVVLADPKCAQLVTLKGFDHVWPAYSPKTKEHPEGTWDKESSAYFKEYSPKHGGGEKPFRVVVHIREYFPEQLNLLCYLMRSVQNLTLAVDELGLFIRSGNAGALPASITSALVSGSHEGLKFCGTAQIPSVVHFIAMGNAKRMRWFRMDEKNSLVAAQTYMPAEFVTSLPSLPDYVCIETSDNKAPAFRDESMVGKIKILGARALAAPTPEK